MKIYKFIGKLVLATLVFTACNNDDDTSVPIPEETGFSKGILVSGEGAGTQGGNITFISGDSLQPLPKVFKTVNNRDLKVFLNSLAFDDTNTYIIIDDDNTITKVNSVTFQQEAILTEGLSTPRFMAINEGKGYVSNWGVKTDPNDDFVAVVDLNSFSVEATIPVKEGPEQVIVSEGTVFVSHKGGFGTNSIVSHFSVGSEQVSEIEVGDNPDEMEIGPQGKLWVLSGGKTVFNADFSQVLEKTAGRITRINVATKEVEQSLSFKNEDQPGYMDIEGNTLFYTVGNTIYQTSIASPELYTNEINVETKNSFYGMTVDEDRIYIADANFAGQSEIKFYTLSTQTWSESIPVGAAAAKIYIRK